MSESKAKLRSALESMVNQFGYYVKPGMVGTGGLSALEEAFSALGWDDPHPAPWKKCDEPGCDDEADCGTPSQSGYRWVCHRHWAQINKANECVAAP